MNIVLLEPEDVQETLWVIHQPRQYQHIIHWNLYYYYSTINDTDKMNQHAVQLKKLQNNAPTELQEYISATLDKTIQLPTTHRRYFYSKLPYRPDYIGYWQLEVPDFS